MSETKEKKLFEVNAADAIYYVSASTPAKARRHFADQIGVRELKAMDAVKIDPKDVIDVE